MMYGVWMVCIMHMLVYSFPNVGNCQTLLLQMIMDSENIVWHFLNIPTNLPNYTDIPTSLADIPDMVQTLLMKE